MATVAAMPTMTDAGQTHPHPHQIIVSNLFSPHGHDGADNSKLSFSSQPQTPTTATPHLNSPIAPSSGLRAQLHHLLPRHAFFHVQIVVHQITNIPLVAGEFAVKWKFKNVHSPPGCKVGDGGGLFARVRARRRARIEERDKGKAGKEDDDGDDTVSLGSSEAMSQHRASIDGRSTAASLWSGKSSSSSSSSSSSHTNTSRTFVHNPSLITAHSVASIASTTTFDTSTTSSSTSSLGYGVAFGTPATATTPPKGQTPFRKLKDHNVTWDHAISLLVRMDVNRDPQSTLMSCPVQLAVLQREPDTAASSDASVHGSGNAKHHRHATRFGVVNLDLAQYACKGEVGRRYLLRESKTNATLKLTTYLTHLPSTHTACGVSTPTSTTPRPSTPTFASGGPPAMFQSNLSTPPAHSSSFSSSASSSLHPSSAFHLSASSSHSNSSSHSSSSSSTSNSWNSTFSAAASPATSSVTNTFTAPPLPRGEILNSISNIVSSGSGLNPFSPLGPTGENDVYRVRPKGLDLYGPYYDQDELEIDLLGGKREARGKAKGKGKGTGKVLEHDGQINEGRDKTDATRKRDLQACAFDLTRLPLAYGPKTTEALIDALFNPVPPTTHEEGGREGLLVTSEDEGPDGETADNYATQSGIDARQRRPTPTPKMLMGSTTPNQSPKILATSPRSVSAPTPILTSRSVGSSTATLTPQGIKELLVAPSLSSKSTSVSSSSSRVSHRPAFKGAPGSSTSTSFSSPKVNDISSSNSN